MRFILVIALMLGGWWWWSAPPDDPAAPFGTLKEGVTSTADAMRDADPISFGQQLYDPHAAVESMIDRSTFVPAEEIPTTLKQAIIATEDKRFYTHGAIDLIGVARALVANYQAGETLQGGSTISQQTVKNLFLSHDRTWMRKTQEMLLSSRLERVYSKEEILELYLNTIYYGAGAYGLQAAALTYFHCDARDLTPAQCTVLAGLPQAPSAYNPLAHFKNAKARQRQVLDAMTEQGMLSPAEAKLLYAADLHLADATSEE